MTEWITLGQFHEAVGPEVQPFWRAVLGYQQKGRPTALGLKRLRRPC